MMLDNVIVLSIALISICGASGATAIEQSPSPTTPTSVCVVGKNTVEFSGKELWVRGHFFQGKEGAMIYDHRCKGYLVVWGSFDKPNQSSGGWFDFHGRIEERSGLGLDGHRTGLVLVVDHVLPAT